MTAPRNRTIDAARGIGILLVVLGHALIYVYDLDIASPSGWPELLRAAIYLFHMPLLFAVSGYVAAARPDSLGLAHLPKRALRLLIPFLAWFMVPVVATVARQSSLADALAALGSGLLAAVRQPQTGLWFLHALFLCFVMLAIARAASRRYDLVAFAAGLALLAFVAPAAGWGIPALAGYGGWFAVGMLAQRQEATLRSIALPRLLAPAVALPVLAVASVPSRIVIADAFRPLLAAGGALAGIVIVIAIASALRETRAAVLLEHLGRESMGIYVFHAFGLGVYARTLDGPLPSGPLGVVAVTALAIAGSLAAVAVTRRVRPLRAALLGER